MSSSSRAAAPSPPSATATSAPPPPPPPPRAPPPPRPWQRVVAGTASGVALVVVGHPLDTLRVRLQTGAAHSLRGAAADLFRAEGVAGLYRGFLPPMALTGTVNASLWGLQFSLTDALAAAGVGGGPDGAPLRALLAAPVASAATALIVAPIENVKTKQQTRGAREGVAAVARSVWAAEGLAGFYTAWKAVVAVRVVGGTAYFVSNQVFLRALNDAAPGGGMANVLLAGGAAGVCYWLPSLPFDTMKSRGMAAPPGAPEGRSLRAAAADVLARYGPRGFYRGLSAAVARAFPANAAAFAAADATMRAINPPRAAVED